MNTPSANSYRFPWPALAAALIVGATALRLAYLAWHCPFDLAPDEAHYWDWSRHPDWCYFSKGPLTAWLIRLSCMLFGPFAQSLHGHQMLAVRLPAVLCGGLLLLGLHQLTMLVHQSAKLACGIVAIALTLPVIAAGSSLMTIDAPFTCCWMWALVFGYRAVFRQSFWAWPAAGMCILLGLLAKHTMGLWLPSFALFLCATPGLRCQLRKPGFWLMTAIGLHGCIPIVVWNADHGWVTWQHAQGHAGLDDVAIHWLGPLQYIGLQAAVLLGFWLIAWALAMWRHRPTREPQPELCYLWWMSAPTFVFFGLFSWKNGGGAPNWPLVAYLSGLVLVAGWLAREMDHPRRWRRQIVQGYTFGAVGLGLLFISIAHEPIAAQPAFLRLTGPASPQHPMPVRSIDPTSRLRGWRYLASEVDLTRADLQGRGITPFLAAERWTQAGELGFYCIGQPNVYCLGALLGDRQSQYDLWRPNPIADTTGFRGETFILVGTNTERLRPFFASCEPTRVVEYRENGNIVATWTITVANGYRP